MKLTTLNFGSIDVPDARIITFAQGLPGFEQLRAFTIIQDEEKLPFSFLQSLEEGDLLFVMTDPFLSYPDYEFRLPEFVQQELGIEDSKQLAVRSIVTIKDNIRAATINLLAPLVINLEKRLGKQIVLQDSSYKTKHPLLRQPDRQAGSGDGHHLLYGGESACSC